MFQFLSGVAADAVHVPVPAVKAAADTVHAPVAAHDGRGHAPGRGRAARGRGRGRAARGRGHAGAGRAPGRGPDRDVPGMGRGRATVHDARWRMAARLGIARRMARRQKKEPVFWNRL